jgi:hypothetical protein
MNLLLAEQGSEEMVVKVKTAPKACYYPKFNSWWNGKIASLLISQ